MRTRVMLWAALIVIGLALTMGSAVMERMAYHESEPEKIVVTETRTVTVEVPKPFIPDSCKNAISLAEQLKEAASALDSASSGQIDIMESAARMIAGRDQAGLTALVQKQREQNTSTLDDAVQLSAGLREYENARTACEKETQ